MVMVSGFGVVANQPGWPTSDTVYVPGARLTHAVPFGPVVSWPRGALPWLTVKLHPGRNGSFAFWVPFWFTS